MTSILVGITIVFSVAWCVTSFLHRASAASRHVVWTCAFAAVLLLAPLRWRLPRHVITAYPQTIGATAVLAIPGKIHSAPFDPTNMLLGIWAAGTLIFTLRLFRNALRLRSIVRRARGVGPILVSSGIQCPLVTGVFRPVILLPETSSAWTLSRRRAVLAHEAAHIRRNDPAFLLAAHIATALYWFHPLCWLAASRLRAESEQACDDAALCIGLKPSVYAGHLLDLARKFNTQLAIPMATTFQLESRMKSILDPSTNRTFPARTVWCAAIVLTAMLLAPLTTITLRAQQTAGAAASISGTVFDPSGARVARAVLTATNSDLNYEVSAMANEAGAFSFTSLPGGHYTVEASEPGFTRFRVADLVLVNGGSVKVDARLSVGKIVMRTTVAGQSLAKSDAVDANGPAQRIRVGGMLQPAKAIYNVQPVYPADLQAQGVEGTVVLQAVISKEGVPISVKLQNAGVNPAFVNAAMTAFSQWRFEPTKLNGEAIEALATNQFDFKVGTAAR